MCRLFGFRSVIQSQVHRSLLAADNALAVQSRKHSDGWGVAYYVADAPHVIKSVQPAIDDHIFHRVSGIVASQTVLAHLRKATVGDVNILNAHPFQYGLWTFAHNGEVRGFEALKEKLRGEVAPALRGYILGDTDSETLFYLFLTYLARLTDIHRKGTPMQAVASALGQMAMRVRELADADLTDATPATPSGCDPDGPAALDPRSKLSFVVTDGATMMALRVVTPLLYSTYKARCFDRDHCPFLAACCEGPTQTGFVNHLIISSEPLQGDNTWIALSELELVGVDWRMQLHRGQVRPDGSVELEAGFRQAATATAPEHSAAEA